MRTSEAQRAGIYFGMVSTRPSLEYTSIAIESFFQNTKLGPADKFLFVDNDGSAAELLLPEFVVRITNDTERGFAANMNEVLRRALAGGLDAVLLNNDLVFTPGWLEPFRSESASVLSPLSNGDVFYEEGPFRAGRAISLDAYRGNEARLLAIAESNHRRHTGFRSVHTFPFFCTRIPHDAISRVGLLDEAFGRAGAEDRDYCIRALLEGFPIRFALSSYVLHFQGRSTWRGGESELETAARDGRYIAQFQEKWGEVLTRLFIMNDFTVLDRPVLRGAWQAGQYRYVIDSLLVEAPMGK